MRKLLGFARALLVFVPVVAVVGQAAGQSTRLVFEVSLNGTDWSSSVAPSSGQEVYVRTRAVLEGATASGLAGFTFQPTITNWGMSNERLPFTNEATGAGVDGSVRTNTGRVNPFAAVGQGTSSSSGPITSFVDTIGGSTRLRIASSSATLDSPNIAIRGVKIAQLPQNLSSAANPYNSNLNVEVFRWKIRLNEIPGIMVFGAPRDLISMVGNQVAGVAWYTGATSANPLYAPIGPNGVSEAVIGFPAPGGVTLAILGLVLGSRRRRT